ncbi:MAG: homoserine kinase [Dehalococcoidia bacterium]
METTAITVRVPATSANLGAGFDCLGLALDLFASISVRFGPEPQAPTDDVGEKMVLTAIRHLYEKIDRAAPPGVDAKYTVSIPLGRGLGASAVARTAGVLAANEFEGRPLDDDGVFSLVTELEGHPDNACPAVFGGVQVCVSTPSRLLHTGCRFPAETSVAVLIPERSIATRDARRVLPDSYAREDAVHNIGRSTLFVAALAAGRLDLLHEATQDRIHQPQRSSLFPGMTDIFSSGRAAGAHAVWLSGSGSCIAALCDPDAGRHVASAMLATLEGLGERGKSIATHISRDGASVSRIELLGA